MAVTQLMSSLPALLVLAPALFTIYIVALVVYRLFLHPLAKYPGPLLGKISDLYSTYHALRGDRHLEFHRLHLKYGPIVRYGPNSLAFNSSSALKEIYSHKANVQKAEFYQAFWASKAAASTHSTIDKTIHARKRRVLSHAFSDAAMKSMERYVLEHIRQFCANLVGGGAPAASSDNKGFGPSINMTDQTNWLAFDTMGDLCFGKSFHMLTEPTNRFATNLVADASHRHLICGTYLPIHSLHLDKLLFPHIAAGRARYMAYSKQQAMERTKLGNADADRRDFFYHLLAAKDPETGSGFAPAELWGESNLLIIAGSDTTSTALAATIFYLAHNPAKLAKVAEEIRAAFPDSVEDIHSSNPALTSKLPYLRACIDEAMRLSPSVGGLLPREVLPGGMLIDGAEIPAGTVVGVPHYAVMHNPAYYPVPHEFVPERWIAGSQPGVTEDSVRAAKEAFCPFSVGPRGCIGKGMAYLELTLTMARTLWLYDMRLAPGETLGEGRATNEDPLRRNPREFQLFDTFTSKKEGPLVQFRVRSRA